MWDRTDRPARPGKGERSGRRAARCGRWRQGVPAERMLSSGIQQAPGTGAVARMLSLCCRAIAPGLWCSSAIDMLWYMSAATERTGTPRRRCRAMKFIETRLCSRSICSTICVREIPASAACATIRTPSRITESEPAPCLAGLQAAYDADAVVAAAGYMELRPDFAERQCGRLQAYGLFQALGRHRSAGIETATWSEIREWHVRHEWRWRACRPLAVGRQPYRPCRDATLYSRPAEA